MRLIAEPRDDYMLLQLNEDRLDAAIAIQFKDAARGLIGAHPGDVVLDLRQVGFLDSSGLGAIVAVMKMVPAPRVFSLSGVTDNVERVLRLTRMDSVIPVRNIEPDSAETISDEQAAQPRRA